MPSRSGCDCRYLQTTLPLAAAANAHQFVESGAVYGSCGVITGLPLLVLGAGLEPPGYQLSQWSCWSVGILGPGLKSVPIVWATGMSATCITCS